MAFKNSTGFQFTDSGVALKYVSGKRESHYVSETGNPGESETGNIPTNNLQLYIKPSTYTSGTTITDSSGYNRTYDLENGVTHNTFPARFTFDGVDDRLAPQSNFSSDIVTNEGTFIAWVRRDGNQDSFAGIMFNRINNHVNGFHLHDSELTLGYHWNNSISTWDWDSEISVPDATWCMVALTVSSTEVKAYLYTTTSTPTTAQNSNSHGSATFQNIEIGRDPYGSRDWKGDIGHALFYSSALSQSQITSIYNATQNTYYGIVEDDALLLHLDAGNTSSYSGSGSAWNNLISSDYHATLYEEAVFESGDGGSIAFDGIDDYAKIEDAESLGKFTGNFTIEFWWKGPSQGPYQTLLDHYEGNNRMQWAVQTANDNMRLRAPDGTFAITTSGVNANNDAWHHHAISRIGSTITYYIDSTSRGTTTEGDQIGTNGDTLDIGRYSGGGYAAEGNMAQLRIYAGKGLTANEVAFNYGNTKGTFGL